MSDAWTALAENYARHRIGYSPEVYDTIVQFGARQGMSVLDVGCGTGIACGPFAANGFQLTGVDPSESMLEKAKEHLPSGTFVKGTAEGMPFPNERFDVAISAQAFHWLNKTRALAEIHRVLRSGGIAAVWWKQLAAQDPVTQLRDDTLKALGKDGSIGKGPAGFKEFYAAPFIEQTLRVIPWRTAVPLERFIGYERSRCNVRTEFGDGAEAYYRELEARMRERFGHDNPAIPLAYVHFLYLARKR